MNINTNTWNKIRYSLYAPGYDIAARILDGSRKKSIDSLHIKTGDKVLIVGAGTGLDIEHLPLGCEITATDITPAMVKKIINRNKKYHHNLSTKVMDGQNLAFENNSFDFVILHLILSVIPNPVACIMEAQRVLKPKGQMGVFDKFIPQNRTLSTRRAIANMFTHLMFSDITRKFEDIAGQTQMLVISDTDADLRGNFRLIKLQKK